MKHLFFLKRGLWAAVAACHDDQFATGQFGIYHGVGTRATLRDPIRTAIISTPI